MEQAISEKDLDIKIKFDNNSKFDGSQFIIKNGVMSMPRTENSTAEAQQCVGYVNTRTRPNNDSGTS